VSKTGDMLLKLAQQNPDVTIRDEMPISGAQRRLETTEGMDVVSQSMQTPESPLEAQFHQLWQMLGGPELEREFRFEPMRRWRADFAHVDSRTLIEVEGGLYQQGRHQRLHGYQADCEKYNWATMTGWRVIRLTSMMLTPDYVESIIKWIQEGEA
jgi:very-short-patch-repair endonuclease